MVKNCKIIHFGPSISGTKSDRDKLIFFTERGGQSDHNKA